MNYCNSIVIPWVPKARDAQFLCVFPLQHKTEAHLLKESRIAFLLILRLRLEVLFMLTRV